MLIIMNFLLFYFREFYYIQMEKYARQAIAEGCKSIDDLVVTTESELYRVLNLHYNRNNQIEVSSIQTPIPCFNIIVSWPNRNLLCFLLLPNKPSKRKWNSNIFKALPPTEAESIACFEHLHDISSVSIFCKLEWNNWKPFKIFQKW